MNTKIRHLVLNPQNVPQRPCDFGLHLPNVQNSKSPSILDLDTAKLFAGKLASENKGTAYYIATVVTGVVAYDVLDGETDKDTKLEWAEASASGTEE